MDVDGGGFDDGAARNFWLRGRERWQGDGEQRDLVLVRRTMDAIGID